MDPILAERLLVVPMLDVLYCKRARAVPWLEEALAAGKEPRMWCLFLRECVVPAGDRLNDL